jgi:adenylate kinase family enzyme
MRRVLVLGCAGAGKTHLTRLIAEARYLPIVHLDRHYWRANWIEPDKMTWADEVARLVEAPTWIMDGNYGGTLPARLTAADTVIYLDFPTWICLARVLRRTLRWVGRTRGEDMAPGCRERFDWHFLKYVLNYRRMHRPRVIDALSGFDGDVAILKTPAQVRTFLDDL